MTTATITLRPISNGTYNEFEDSPTWSASPTSWQQVDEETADGNTTFIQNAMAGNPGARNTFIAAAPPSELRGATIDSVTVALVCRRIAADPVEVAPLLRLHGSDYAGTLQAVTENAAFQTKTEAFNVNPTTGKAWVYEDLLPWRFEFGALCGGAVNDGLRLTQVYAEVVYQPSNLRQEKQALFHVYTSAGVFKRVWPDVATLPAFRWPINGGPSSMTVVLPREWGALGETGEVAGVEDIRLGNIVEVYVLKHGRPQRLVYRGAIEKYEAVDPPAEGLQLTLVPKTARFSDAYISELVELTAYDPSDALKHLLDAGYIGAGLAWDPSNPLVGVLFSQPFEKVTAGKVMDIIRRMAGGKWYWRLNPDDSLTFNRWDLQTAQHNLNANHFSSVRYIRSMLDVKTRVFVYGAELKDEEGIVTRRVQAVSTSAAYDPDDPRDDRHVDARITDDATAQRIAHSIREFKEEESIETEIEVLDDALDPERGYDIEVLRPGDTLALTNPRQVYPVYRVGTSFVDDAFVDTVYAGLVQMPLVIAEVDYRFTSARVKLTTRPAPVVEELVNVSERTLLEGSA